MRILFFTLMGLLVGLSGIGQNQILIDTLEEHLEKKSLSDSEKVDTYVLLAREYRYSDSITTAFYGNKARALAESIGYEAGQMDALYEIGWVTMTVGYYTEAEVLFHQIVQRSSKLDYDRGRAKGYNGLGMVRDYIGDYSKALDNYFKALNISEDIGDDQGVALSLNNIGVIYDLQGRYDQALEYYQKSLEVKHKTGDKVGIAASYNNISGIYYQKGAYALSLEYDMKSLAIKEELRNKVGIATSYSNIGETYMIMGNYPMALEYYQKSLDLRKQMGARSRLTYPLIGIGEVHFRQSNFLEARKYFKEAIRIARETGLAQNIKLGAEKLALTEEKLGNYRAAYEAQVLFHQMSDSLNNTESTRKLTRLQTEYEFRQELDSVQHASDKQALGYEIKIQKQRTLTYSFVGGIGSLIVVLLIGVRYYRLKSQANEKLELLNKEITDHRDRLTQTNQELDNLNKEKNKLIGILAHDLRSPLNQIVGFINLFVMNVNKDIDEENKAMLDYVVQGADRMGDMVNRILDVSAIEGKKIDLQIETIETAPFIAQQQTNFSVIAVKKGQKVIVNENPQGVFVDVDKNYLIQCMENLISNALKFAPANTSVYLEVAASDAKVDISVRDEGPGISEKDQEHLFSAFSQLTAKPTLDEKSTGLGLSIVKKYIEAMSGRITCESELGKGATFRISFERKGTMRAIG